MPLVFAQRPIVIAPVTLIEDHVAAVLARLREDPQLTDVIFEGDPVGDPERYANVYHDTGFFDRSSYVRAQHDVTVTFTIHSVGAERWQAAWVASRIVSSLLGFLPDLPGRRCWRMTAEGTQPVRRDDGIVPPKFLAVNRFALRSTPA